MPGLKVIVAGSRTINDFRTISRILDRSRIRIGEIVSGHAQGVDLLGERWADMNDTPVTEFIADWAKWGKTAGPKRNRQMAAYADALILIWDGKSRGSKSMLTEATKRGLIIEQHIIGATVL